MASWGYVSVVVLCCVVLVRLSASKRPRAENGQPLHRGGICTILNLWRKGTGASQ